MSDFRRKSWGRFRQWSLVAHQEIHDFEIGRREDGKYQKDIALPRTGTPQLATIIHALISRQVFSHPVNKGVTTGSDNPACPLAR